MSPNAGAEAEAKGGEAAGDQPVGKVEERAGGPQEDTRTQTWGLNQNLVDLWFREKTAYSNLRPVF